MNLMEQFIRAKNSEDWRLLAGMAKTLDKSNLSIYCIDQAMASYVQKRTIEQKTGICCVL